MPTIPFTTWSAGRPTRASRSAYARGGYAIDLARIKAPDERAVLVATEPLTYEEGWTGLGRGELLVVREGRVERGLI